MSSLTAPRLLLGCPTMATYWQAPSRYLALPSDLSLAHACLLRFSVAGIVGCFLMSLPPVLRQLLIAHIVLESLRCTHRHKVREEMLTLSYRPCLRVCGVQDIVTRYASTTGHHVARRFGWDCHGLPVEYEIDQKLGIKSKDDVMALGIANYNEECRAIVMRYSKEWEKTVSRLGRWIDFENDYKTLDASYMESVWWVFSQLYAKGLVYKGFKVMPYSTGCTTPLSNFEAGLNYKVRTPPAGVPLSTCWK